MFVATCRIAHCGNTQEHSVNFHYLEYQVSSMLRFADCCLEHVSYHFCVGACEHITGGTSVSVLSR